MSTDSTELTFIRCPSCRSLVPAVSPRCRMCGAVLDAGKNDAAASDDSGSSKKSSSRVRQQTVAVSDHDVRAAKANIESQDRPAVKMSGKQQESVAYQNVSSPEEDLEDISSAPDFESPSSSEAETSLDSQDNTDFGDPLGAFIEEVPVEDSITASGNLETANELNGTSEHAETLDASQTESVSNAVKPVAPAGSGFQAKRNEVKESAPAVEARPRVVIESGSRRGGMQKSGISFGKGKPDSSVAARPIAQETRKDPEAFGTRPTVQLNPAQLNPAQLNPAQLNPAQTSPAAQAKSAINSAPQAELKTVVENDSPPAAFESKPAAKSHNRAETFGSSIKPVEGSSKGRLYGWLVSYADARGIANELRDGKFFVSRASLKGTDLILDDDSVSTPHALIGVNVNEGLIVQDLMSDRGVFVRKNAGEAYQRVLESTKLEHGDWVRFGDVEFLVAIISLPSGR